MNISIDEKKCIGCGTCEAMCSECFEMDGRVAKVKKGSCDKQNVKDVAEGCPVGAIVVDN